MTELVDLLAVVDTAGIPTRRLFGGVLLVEYQTLTNRVFIHFGGRQLAQGQDWETLIDTLFAPGGPLSRLDSTVAWIDAHVGGSSPPVKVSFLLPYPSSEPGGFFFRGRRYNCDSLSGRVEAIAAYAAEVQDRLVRAQFRRLQLGGFQWGDEGVLGMDSALVTRVAAAVHRLRVPFLWVPYFKAPGSLTWRQLGFDAAWLQPNYFFHPEVPTERLDSAVAIARRAGMGLEIEFDERIFAQAAFRDRLEPYLAAIESAPDLRSRSIVLYEGAGALLTLARRTDDWGRVLYHRLAAVLAPVPNVLSQ